MQKGYALLLLLCILPLSASALETDNYSNRLKNIGDALPIADKIANDALERIVSEWDGPRDDLMFADKVFEELGGLLQFSPHEREALDAPGIERYNTGKYNNVYFKDVPFYATHFLFFEGVPASIRLNNVVVGTDKFGHFYYLGLRYFKRYKRGQSQSRILKNAEVAERLIWGTMFTGIFSNSDLVVNYEGLLFYRSLFKGGVVADKPAIVHWENDTPVIQRVFTYADHVNDFWDEALNPPQYTRVLQKHMNTVLEGFCGDYAEAPERFTTTNRKELEKRYENIHMRPAPQNRIDLICSK